MQKSEHDARTERQTDSLLLVYKDAVYKNYMHTASTQTVFKKSH